MLLAIQALKADGRSSLVMVALIATSVLSVAGTHSAFDTLAGAVGRLAEQGSGFEVRVDIARCPRCAIARRRSVLLQQQVESYRTASVRVLRIGPGTQRGDAEKRVGLVCYPLGVRPRDVRWGSVQHRNAWADGAGDATVLVGAHALPRVDARPVEWLHTTWGTWRVAGMLRERPLLSPYAVENAAVLVPDREPFTRMCSRGVPSWRIRAPDSASVARRVDVVNGELRTVLRLPPGSKAPWQMTRTDRLAQLLGSLVIRLRRWVMLVPIAIVLLCGAGVFNVRVVASAERIAEIGVRRALGATSGMLAAQLVLEGLLLLVAGTGAALMALLLLRGDAASSARAVTLALPVVIPLMTIGVWAPMLEVLRTPAIAALEGRIS